MKTKGIKGLISLKVLLNKDEDSSLSFDLTNDKELFLDIKEKVVKVLGEKLANDILIYRENDGIYVIVRIGDEPDYRIYL